MTTASEIITRAYRDPNIIAVGKTPTTAEVTEALPLLKTILKNVFGRKLGEFVEDWPIGTFYTSPDNKQYPFYSHNVKPSAELWRYPPQNSRLLTRLTAADTVYFEPYPDDGAQMIVVDNGNDWSTRPLTIDFNGRSGLDSATATSPVTTVTISVAPTTPIHWVYRADLGRWEWIADIAIDGTGTENMPLPEEFDDWFSISLAARLAPRYSKELNALLIAVAQDLEQQMETRYRQSARVNVHRRGEDQRTIQTLGGGFGDEGNLLS